MKTTIKMIFASAAIMLSACNKEDVHTLKTNFPADGVIRVATNVSAPTSRAGMTSDNITDQGFSIWITPQGETQGSSAYIYNNKAMHYANTAWAAYEHTDPYKTTPLTLLWKNSTTLVDVVALYIGGANTKQAVLSSTPINRHITANQSNANGWVIEGNDLLYFKGTINPSSTVDVKDAGDNITQYGLTSDGKMRIPLRHINSKLHIAVTLGTELNTTPGTATNPISGVTIKGTVCKYALNMTTGVITKQLVDAEPILPFTGTYAAGSGTLTKAVANYEAILVPQAVTANTFEVSFTIDGKNYTWVSTAAVTLESGKLHTLTLTAGKDIVTLDGFTTGQWTNGTGGNVETE